MEAKAQARFIRVTPQKSRRVVNEVRGKRVLGEVGKGVQAERRQRKG